MLYPVRERISFPSIMSKILPIRTSLRARVALGVALPLLLMMVGLSLFHYLREVQILEEQIRLSAVQLGDMLNNSISHAMLIKDDKHLMSALSDVSSMENVDRVQIVGISGKVLVASEVVEESEIMGVGEPQCWACHQYTAGNRPRAVELDTFPDTLRISTPVLNYPECLECHRETEHHLGVLLIDMSLADMRNHLRDDLRMGIAITILATAVITIGMFHLLNRLVVRRIESFREPLTAYATGEYSLRLAKCNKIEDEICQLAATFNHMADEIERYTLELDELNKIRQQAIIAERERISRELHDGVAQVLGYVTTKSNAVRLMLQKNHLEDADRHLHQLEIAAQDLFVDIREAILGLRVASQVDSNLPDALADYVQQFNLMSEVTARLELPSKPLKSLPPETVLHMLRVVQEALTNARKHAQATQIRVALSQERGTLYLEVYDNGQGFTQREISRGKNGNFGLSTMQERADEIGALLKMHSEIGTGTHVKLILNIDGERSRPT